MKTQMDFPDKGADLVVRTRSGKEYRGTVWDPHVFCPDDVLCLVQDPGHTGVTDYENDSAERLWQYIRISDIESWTWDCRP